MQFTAKNIRARLRGHTILAIVLAILISGVSVYFGKEAAAVTSDVRAAREQAANAIAEHEAALDLLTAFDTYYGNRGRLYDALPPADYVVPVIDGLKQAASESAVTAVFTVSDPILTKTTIPAPNGTSTERLFTLAITADISGNATGLEHFITAVEALPFFIRVDDLSAESDAQGGWEQAEHGIIHMTLFTRYQ